MKGDLGLTQENMNSRGPPSPLLSCVRIIHDPWLVTWIWLVSEMYIHILTGLAPTYCAMFASLTLNQVFFFFFRIQGQHCMGGHDIYYLPQLETNQPHPWVFQQESSSSIMTDLRDRLGRGTPTLIPKSMTGTCMGVGFFVFVFLSWKRELNQGWVLLVQVNWT